jgi:hypothetical protein
MIERSNHLFKISGLILFWQRDEPHLS